jgi:thiosulfate dehydrogenase
MKPLFKIIAALSLTLTLNANAIDPLEVRPSMVEPKVSIPTHLVSVPVVNPGEYYLPPRVDDIPDNEYGEMVRLGRNIFVNTQKYAKRYVGNGLECTSCHLGEGRQPHASPMWAAYGKYPAYRNKTQKVMQMTQRVQSCFKYSMNGMAPTVDAPEMDALITYFAWLSKDVPIGVTMPGRGFASIKKTQDPSSINGKILYETMCAMCHGMEGQGQKRNDGVGYQFPPLWGTDTFNRKAGLNKVKTMAQFVKANMPLGSGYTLTDNEALDISYYVWIHDKNEDPTSSTLTNTLQPKLGSGR